MLISGKFISIRNDLDNRGNIIGKVKIRHKSIKGKTESNLICPKDLLKFFTKLSKYRIITAQCEEGKIKEVKYI